MQVLIHIDVDQSIHEMHYHKPVVEWTRTQLPRVVTFDFDNLSETSVSNYAIDLMNQADQLFVIIDVNIDKNLGSITRFVDGLTRQKGKSVILLLNGQSALLQQMGATLGERNFKTNLADDDQKDLIMSFFNRRLSA